ASTGDQGGQVLIVGSKAMTSRPTAQDFAPEVLRLFDQYVHGQLSRRGFLNSAAQYAVGAVTAEMLLSQLSPNFAHAQQVQGDDPRIVARYVEIASPQGYGKV